MSPPPLRSPSLRLAVAPLHASSLRRTLTVAALSVSDRVEVLFTAAECHVSVLPEILTELRVERGRFAWASPTRREVVLTAARDDELREAHSALASTLTHFEEPALALWHAARAEPGRVGPSLLLGLAEDLLAAGSAEASLTVARSVLERHPTSPRATLAAGRAALGTGDLTEAIRYLSDAAGLCSADELALAREHLLAATTLASVPPPGARAGRHGPDAAAEARRALILLAACVTQAGRRGVDALTELTIAEHAEAEVDHASSGRGEALAFLSHQAAPASWPWNLVPGPVTPFEERLLAAQANRRWPLIP